MRIINMKKTKFGNTNGINDKNCIRIKKRNINLNNQRLEKGELLLKSFRGTTIFKVEVIIVGMD